MQLAGLSYMSAPQVTGPPLSLPGVQTMETPAAAVTPILDARRPETQLGADGSHRSFIYAMLGEPDPAKINPPPSIMQIKITQMLQDQALQASPDDPSSGNTQPTSGTPGHAGQNGDAVQPGSLADDSNRGAVSGTLSVAISGSASGMAASLVPERAPMTLPIRAASPLTELLQTTAARQR